MGTMINKGKEMIRISPKQPNKIEVSKNEGRTWSSRSSSSSYGDFSELTDNGKEILGTTSKGLYVSKNDGRTWSKRS